MPAALHFTTRRGGDSTGRFTGFNLADHVGDDPGVVSRHRAQLAASLGADRVVWMRQVHGSHVVVVDGSGDVSPPEADVLVTVCPGLALGVLVADCVPLLLHDTEGRAVAAVHAGREGLLRGVVPAAVAALAEVGAPAGDLLAELGPSIGPCCYEVSEALRDQVSHVVPQARARTRWGTPALDLPAGVAAQLRAAGVSRVVMHGVCTAESVDHYSYRRDGVTGRFAGTVMIPR